jgi:hypothetical protein
MSENRQVGEKPVGDGGQSDKNILF